MSAPTILLVSGRSWSTVSAGVQGMVPVSWFDLVRCLLRSPLVPSERASSVGWLQSALAALVGEERYAGFLRVPGQSRGVGVGGGVFGPGLPIGGTAWRRSVPEPPGGLGATPARALARTRRRNRQHTSQTTIPGTIPCTPVGIVLHNRPDTNSFVGADICVYSIVGAVGLPYGKKPLTCLWASIVL